LKQTIDEKLVEHRLYIREHGQDMPEISGWRWGIGARPDDGATSTEGDNV
jgi:xylulose-5-phosphate/fructose-6-phosphate phosphoketolase